LKHSMAGGFAFLWSELVHDATSCPYEYYSHLNQILDSHCLVGLSRMAIAVS
jgi:hypothetical protein